MVPHHEEFTTVMFKYVEYPLASFYYPPSTLRDHASLSITQPLIDALPRPKHASTASMTQDTVHCCQFPLLFSECGQQDAKSSNMSTKLPIDRIHTSLGRTWDDPINIFENQGTDWSPLILCSFLYHQQEGLDFSISQTKSRGSQQPTRLPDAKNKLLAPRRKNSYYSYLTGQELSCKKT